MFLIAATRVYDPIGSMFANMAAVFACEVRIERMQEIENEKRMTGMTEYDPDGYDIRFEHVTFAYREKEDVLRDVSFTAKQGQVTALVGPSGGGGENGSRLSGGERQRISIARAILKDAPVILLDEATASLDVENETAVQAALSGLIRDKTVLIIAHRMRTVMNADQIVLLSGGRVVEMGSPAELLKKNGLFRHMAQLQSESLEWTA